MKMKTVIIIALRLMPAICFSQAYNVQGFKGNRKHLVFIDAGLEYGSVINIGYAQRISTARPIMAGLELSVPAGNEIIDDYQLKAFLQLELLHCKRFVLTGSFNPVFRRLVNDLYTASAVACELGLTTGFYYSGWYVAGEFITDQSFLTHIKHSDQYVEGYPGAKSGWYSAMARTFNYGVQAGFNIRETGINLRIGLSGDKKFSGNTLPFYCVLGVNRFFNQLNH